jgi:putative nucleotidyltransferase with HDIG domain
MWMSPEVEAEMSAELLLKQAINSEPQANLVQALLGVVAKMDNETFTHSFRVAELTLPIGAALHFSDDRLETLHVSSLLHDLGKVYIPQQIYLKHGNLSEEEQWIMQKHPEYGAAILEQIPDFSTIAKIVLSHHERYDGNGYPQKIGGAEIPLCARILAVADSYDAMINTRAYREGVSSKQAIEELIQCSGTQFDPMVVDAFLATVTRTRDFSNELEI